MTVSRIHSHDRWVLTEVYASKLLVLLALLFFQRRNAKEWKYEEGKGVI